VLNKAAVRTFAPIVQLQKLPDAVCHQHVSCTLDRPKREHFYRAACMECRRGLGMRILSVCPSVGLSVNRVICDKTKEIVSAFLYHIK